MTSMESPQRQPGSGDIATQLAERLVVLDGLDARPLAEHPDVYQQLHAELQATLAEIDTA